MLYAESGCFFLRFFFFSAARFQISDFTIVNISATLLVDDGIRWLGIVAVLVIKYQNVFAYLFSFFFFIVSISLSGYDSHRISFVFAIFLFEFFAKIGQRMTRNWANIIPITWASMRRSLITLSQLCSISPHADFGFAFVPRYFPWRKAFALIMADARSVRMRFGGFRANIRIINDDNAHTYAQIERRSPSTAALNMQFLASTRTDRAASLSAHHRGHSRISNRRLQSHHDIHTRRASNRISCTNDRCLRVSISTCSPNRCTRRCFRSIKFDASRCIWSRWHTSRRRNFSCPYVMEKYERRSTWNIIA